MRPRFSSEDGDDKNDNRRSPTYQWFYRNRSILIVLSFISIAFLFALHIFTTTTEILLNSAPSKIIQIITIVLISLISLSIIWRGLIPIVICALGIALIYGGIIIPSYALTLPTNGYFKGIRVLIDQQIISMATESYFFLGIAMVILSMIIAYKPTLLYVKNRPEPFDTLWAQYQKWNNNWQLAGGYTERSIPLKNLMKEQEKYILWRYEYVLTNIYNMAYLVEPNGFVPKSSTIVRDKNSGRMIGISRYSGYFM
ncbi:MAG: hypothetical protein ACJ71I_08440 [Nitrososphaeraceae archaeon]